MMIRLVPSLFLLACAFQVESSGQEPLDYNHMYAVEPGSAALQPLPYEPVRTSGKRTDRIAAIPGSHAKLRFREGALPALIIKYPVGYASPTAARLYLMQSEPDRRTVRLGLWAYSSAKRQVPGAVPVKIERYGKVSYRVIPPPVLRPGEYAISNLQGSGAFTFGVDPK